ETEVRRWMRTHTIDLTEGGSVLPAVLGKGLKADSPPALFLKNDAIVQQAHTVVTGSSSGDVMTAHRMVGMIRDVAFSAVSDGTAEISGLQNAVQLQQQMVTAGVKSVSAFGGRIQFLGDLLGLSGYQAQSLKGMEPGRYTQQQDTGGSSQ